jgi:serine/threonine protein kinase
MDDSVLAKPASQVGPYILTRRLGVGGMGEVWAGRRTHGTGAYKTVAVKLLPSGRAHDENSRRMFDDEARLSMLLCNSNIVQVFDVGEDAGVCYMAMEWVDGLNLDELGEIVRERGEVLPLSVVGYIVGEILKALAYAHDLEHEGKPLTVVHRDVSAHNVMISVAGEVKLMDFGIARVASEATSGVHVKGKLRYMPPEQLRGDTRAPTIDLFAVGAILHELLDGRRFRSGVVDEARLYGMVLDGEVPPPTCPSERVPPKLEALRSGLLKAKVADRIQSAREAHRYLSAWTGYRDAKFELQDLVRGCANPPGSRTEILPVFERAQTNEQTSQLAPFFQTASTDQKMERSVTVREPTRPAAPAELRHPSVPKWTLMTFAIGLPVAVLALGAVGLIWFAARAEPTGEAGAPANPGPTKHNDIAAVTHAADESSTAKPPPITSLDASEPSDPRPNTSPPAIEIPTPAPSDRIEPASADEPDTMKGTISEAPESGQERPQAPAKPRVSVKVTAPQAFWLEVEVAGKSHLIDRMGGAPEAQIRLRPGDYRVRYRSDAGGAWRSGGTVTIPETTEPLVMKLQPSGKFAVE